MNPLIDDSPSARIHGPSWRTKRASLTQLACVIAVVLLWPISARAATAFYVDPDWTGTKTGAAATPWSSLTSGAWTTINTALASGDVVVYFSARQAGSDTNETTTTALNLTRTSTSAYRLTLDGQSLYNANDSAPSWQIYTGTSRFQVTASVPVSTGYIAFSNITVRGFRLIATGGQIIFWYGGDNVTWENNEGSASASNTWGPGFYFQYTEHEGGTTCPTPNNNESCVASTNLVIRGNYIHDTFGEGIYVGGCANNSGCLSHNGITIENNTIRNVAVYGGEPDAIDLKDGLRNVVVRGNDIRLQRDSRAGITTESGALVERNYIESAGWAAVAFSVFWNQSGATRAGTVARNNLLINSGGNLTSGFGSRYGIYIDNAASGDLYTDLKVYSNTVYGVLGPTGTGYGISVAASGTTVVNNIAVNAYTYPLRAAAGTLIAHSNNLFYQPTPGAVVVSYGGSTFTSSTITNFEASALSVDPQFVSGSSPYAPTNFYLQKTSPARKAGTPIASFSDDYFGVTRGSAWDLGAVQSSDIAPSSPTNLRIIRG